jgi:hypothetical protein
MPPIPVRLKTLSPSDSRNQVSAPGSGVSSSPAPQAPERPTDQDLAAVFGAPQVRAPKLPQRPRGSSASPAPHGPAPQGAKRLSASSSRAPSRSACLRAALGDELTRLRAVIAGGVRLEVDAAEITAPSPSGSYVLAAVRLEDTEAGEAAVLTQWQERARAYEWGRVDHAVLVAWNEPLWTRLLAAARLPRHRYCTSGQW